MWQEARNWQIFCCIRMGHSGHSVRTEERASHFALTARSAKLCIDLCERICRRERAIHRFHLMQFSDAFSGMKIVTSPIDVRPSHHKWHVLLGCKIKFCLKIMAFSIGALTFHCSIWAHSALKPARHPDFA